MFVGNSFVIFMSKTIFEIGCWVVIVTLYEGFKITFNNVRNNLFVRVFFRSCSNNYVFLSNHVYSFSNIIKYNCD